jgi:hypothetical protein
MSPREEFRDAIRSSASVVVVFFLLRTRMSLPKKSLALKRRVRREHGACAQTNNAGLVFLGAVLKHLVVNVLEPAAAEAEKDKRVRIMPKHVAAAVQDDVELQQLQLFGDDSPNGPLVYE